MIWLRELARWRTHAEKIACAARTILPNAETYVTGGAAEDRLTAASDIDIVIALPSRPTYEEAVEIRTKILEEAEKIGLPPTAPVELHIVAKEDLNRYRTLKRITCSQDAATRGE